MPIQVLVPLLLQYTVPFVDKIFTLWLSKADVTPAEWDALKLLANQSRLSQMTEALIRNGIDPASDKGKALLALVV